MLETIKDIFYLISIIIKPLNLFINNIKIVLFAKKIINNIWLLANIKINNNKIKFIFSD